MADKILNGFEVWVSAQGLKSKGRLRDIGNISLEGISRFRQLILTLALSGKLVEQNSNDEPIEKLIKEIGTIRRTLNPKLTKGSPLQSASNRFRIPETWKWVKLEELAIIIRGVSYKKELAQDREFSGSISLLRANNIDKKISFIDTIFIPRNLVSSEQIIKKGDLLIAMSSGSANLVGKAAQATSDLDSSFGAFCGVIRSYSYKLHSYFRIFFSSHYYRSQASSFGRGIGINNISKNDLEMLAVPLPPYEEQHRIAAKVDELMALCDELEQQETRHLKSHQLLVETLLGTLTRVKDAADFQQAWNKLQEHFDDLFTTEDSIDQLKQTILQLAVMGKLVRQDPNEIVNESFENTKTYFDSKPEDLDIDIPKNWKALFLEQCFEIKSGSTIEASKELESGNYMYLKVADLNLAGNEKEITISSRYINPEVKDLKAVVPRGSIIFPKRGGAIATNKKRLVRKDLFVDLNIMSISPKSGIDLDYAFYWLEGIDLAKLNSGTSVPQINHKDIGPLVFPLPPRNEQARIVSKVNDLFALCDRLKERIAEAQKIANQMAEAVVEQV